MPFEPPIGAIPSKDPRRISSVGDIDIGNLRRRTGKKWTRYGPSVLPAWVADTDLTVAPVIREAIEEALAEGDLGYPPLPQQSGLPTSFAQWAERRWSWSVDPALVHVVPDVVRGIELCLETCTRPGDGVAVQTPVYPAFLTAIRSMGRRVVSNPLIEGRIDIDGLCELVVKERVRALLVCNPHNPTGRVFHADELSCLARVAETFDLAVISDEIHADLAYPGHIHIPFLRVSPKVASRTYLLNSASKAFNVAGLRAAVVVAGTDELFVRIRQQPPHYWYGYSTLGVRASRAAWTDSGEEWLEHSVRHFRRVRDDISTLLPEVLPSARWSPPEAGFLAWIDVSDANLPIEPATFFLDRAAVALSFGGDFGKGGEGYIRLNFGTSSDIVSEILRRMGRAVDVYHSATG